MADDSGYEEDAGRIEDKYVDPSSMTMREIRADLKDAGFPDESIDYIAGSESEEGWLTTIDDAADLVSPRNQSTEAFARSIDRNTDGTISETRARSMGEQFESEINQARGEAAQRIGSDGNVRTEDGQIIGKPGSVSEEVRDDGIYYVNDNTGTEGRAASIDLGGVR